MCAEAFKPSSLQAIRLIFIIMKNGTELKACELDGLIALREMTGNVKIDFSRCPQV